MANTIFPTLADLRGYPGIPASAVVSDAVLGDYADAAAADVVKIAGNGSSVTETLYGGGEFLLPTKVPGTITQVRTRRYPSASWTTIGTTDYEVAPGGQALRRVSGGSVGVLTWSGTYPVWEEEIEITYVPKVVLAKLRIAVAQIIVLDLQRDGLASVHIGDYSEGRKADVGIERASVLRGLMPRGGMVIA